METRSTKYKTIHIMANFKFLLLSVLMLFASAVFAKDGKIKYGKFIRYEGSIVDKQANGTGTLRIYDAKEKDLIALSFSGEFSTVSFIKDVLKQNKVKYDLTTLKITKGTVQLKDGWKYVGDIDITIDDYNKQNAVIINAVLENGYLYNNDETTKILTKKITCEITTLKDEEEIVYSPSVDDELYVNVIKSGQRIVVSSSFDQMFFKKTLAINDLVGKAFLDQNGLLRVTEATTDNSLYSYKVKQSGSSLILVDYTYRGLHFESSLNELYLKTIRISDSNCSIKGELTDIHQNLYHGTIAGSGLAFDGDYTIIFTEEDPDAYASASLVKTLINYKSGTLSLNGNNYNGSWDNDHNFHGTLKTKDGIYEGDWDGIKFKGTYTKGNEIYKGSWDDNHNFKGSYSNEDLLINLKECYVKDDILCEGVGEKTILPDSVVYSGPFKGLQCYGEGKLKYKSFDPIIGVWENDNFIKGHTTINMAGKSLSYEIIPTDGGYDYFFNERKVGTSESLASLFKDIMNLVREKCRKEILSSSDVSKANRLFKGEEFFGTLDPGILFDNGVDAELGRDLFDKIGTLCLDVNFTSYNECIYHVYLDTSHRSGGYNSMDLLLGGDPFASDLLFGVLRATMSDFEQKIKCIYTVKNDSIIMYKANSLELCDRMKILNNGQKLQAKQKRGYMTISKVR